MSKHGYSKKQKLILWGGLWVAIVLGEGLMLIALAVVRDKELYYR
jgi:hypothetical protein